MMQTLFQWITRPIRYGINWYLSKPRDFRFRDISVTVLPGVFHPGFFFSTRMILEFLETQNFNNTRFIELGCGSGVISILAAKKGAAVTASDINLQAVENVRRNSELNNIDVEIVHSDLFDSIPHQKFDWIVVNPPYYPSNAKTDAEYAWYCGEDHQYFEKLFKSLPSYIHEHSKVLIVLSEVCDLERIFSIIQSNGFQLNKISEKRIWVDGKNFLYWIRRRQ